MTFALARRDAAAHLADRWPELLFAVLFATAVPVDLWLVYTGRESISARCWDATQAHTTVIWAFAIAGGFAGWLLRKSWPAVLLWGILIGHLGAHW